MQAFGDLITLDSTHNDSQVPELVMSGDSLFAFCLGWTEGDCDIEKAGLIPASMAGSVKYARSEREVTQVRLVTTQRVQISTKLYKRESGLSSVHPPCRACSFH